MIFYNEPNRDVFEMESNLIRELTNRRMIPKNDSNLKNVIQELDASVFELNQHKNPNFHLPPVTKFRLVKLIVLKLIKVYTAIQVHFNDLVVKNLNFQKNATAEIVNQLGSLENELTKLRKESKKIVKEPYRSIYFQKESNKFYEYLETIFRGPEDLITKRQLKYSKYIKQLVSLSKKYPFLDIGFGRGEFLAVLKNVGVSKIVGIDTNKIYVSKAKDNGFNVFNRDAISYLSHTDNIFCGISMFHLVEHFSFPEIFDLLQLCYNRLSPNGKLIIETPNPNNLQVSSYSFYYDYTHITKVPAEFLKAILLYLGFKEIEVVYASPFNNKKKTELEKMIYGPREYGIIASK